MRARDWSPLLVSSSLWTTALVAALAQWGG